MTFQSAQNAAYSLVATAPSTPTGGLSLVVTAGEGARFSAITLPFYATVWAANAQPIWAAGGATAGNFEIVQVTNVSTDTLTIVRAREGTTARTILVGDQIAETWTAATFRNAQNLPRSARSSNTILGVTDGGTVICATAAYTQTLTAAATLGAGWWVIVKNDTTSGTVVLTVTPNGSETIDGLTPITMYSGETRLIECDGANFTSQLLAGGYAKFAPTGGTFVVPAGISQAAVVCVGSGGQGGAGYTNSGGSCSGGGGGGGGAAAQAVLRGSDLGAAGASITVTVAAGGSAAGAAGSPGSDGSNGSATTFGTLVKAGGGGGGKAAALGAAAQGGSGASTVNNAATTTPGAPASAAGSAAIAGQAAASGTGNAAGVSSEWGGASGSGSVTGGSSTIRTGGSSIWSGPGGGGGGGVATATGQVPGAGGATQSYAGGGGGGAGTSGGTTVKGGDGTFTGPYCGAGGGGGGAGSTGVTGKDGGAGSIGAGGGGGGSSASTTAGNGGAGGAGECRVWYS